MTDHRPLVERLYTLIDQNRYDGAAQLMNADCELVTPETTLTGPAEISAYCGAYDGAFPDAGYSITATYSTADVVVVQGTWNGTNTGPLVTPAGGVPATGRRVSLSFCSVARLRGGRFASMHMYWDSQAMLAQLGLVPQPAAA
jgi:ketosteroid isomerase-like protein